MSLDDLGSILDNLKAESPSRSLASEEYEREKIQWTDADKEPSIQLTLSRYELYWLEWRIAVHLISYSAVEWSEMKDALKQILSKLRALPLEGLPRCFKEVKDVNNQGL